MCTSHQTHTPVHAIHSKRIHMQTYTHKHIHIHKIQYSHIHTHRHTHIHHTKPDLQCAWPIFHLSKSDQLPKGGYSVMRRTSFTMVSNGIRNNFRKLSLPHSWFTFDSDTRKTGCVVLNACIVIDKQLFPPPPPSFLSSPPPPLLPSICISPIPCGVGK